MSLYTYVPKSFRVVDGDTVDVVLDLGFGVFHDVRLRIKGVNCPERFTEEGKKATLFTTSWLAAYSPSDFTVQTFKDGTDKYGRYVATIKVTEHGHDLTQDLINAGLGVPLEVK